MKLHLGLLFEDLGDSVFQCWIHALSKSFALMTYLPDEEKIRGTTPLRFQKFSRLNGIIDCSEMFFETPKSMELHGVHKHLILPNSFITYVSEPFTGRISD